MSQVLCSEGNRMMVIDCLPAFKTVNHIIIKLQISHNSFIQNHFPLKTNILTMLLLIYLQPWTQLLALPAQCWLQPDEILPHSEDRNIYHSVPPDTDNENNVLTGHLLFYIGKTSPVKRTIIYLTMKVCELCKGGSK